MNQFPGGVLYARQKSESETSEINFRRPFSSYIFWIDLGWNPPGLCRTSLGICFLNEVRIYIWSILEVLFKTLEGNQSAVLAYCTVYLARCNDLLKTHINPCGILSKHSSLRYISRLVFQVLYWDVLFVLKCQVISAIIQTWKLGCYHFISNNVESTMNRVQWRSFGDFMLYKTCKLHTVGKEICSFLK